MKVLYINTVCGRSSTGGIIRDIDAVLRINGHESLTLFGRYTAPDNINSICIDNKLDVYIHVLITRLFDRQGFGSICATKRAIRIIEDYKPDIIHIHNIHGNYINIKLLFSYLKKCGIPIVWTMHDCWPFTGHCPHYIYNACYKWRDDVCSKCPRKKEYPASYLLDNSTRNFLEKRELFTGVPNLIITTVSDWLKEQVKESFLSEYPVLRIYNGIDCDKYRPKESDIRKRLNIAEDRKIILSIADGWSERKGMSLIFSIDQKLRQLNLPVQFLMVGVQKELILKIPDSIIALQRTDSIDALVELYSTADIMFNPSQVETFGLVNVEALACGTPVITMGSTACPESVDSTCGVVINISNSLIDSVVDAITILLKNKPSKECCRKKALSFSKENSYISYIELYKKCLKGDVGHYEQK